MLMSQVQIPLPPPKSQSGSQKWGPFCFGADHACVGEQTLQRRPFMIAFSLFSESRLAMNTPTPQTDKSNAQTHTTAEQVSETVKKTVEEINAEAAELMHRSSQALHEQTEHLRTQVREVREKTLGYIQHEPVKSVFIAAATGAALVLLSNWLSQRIK